MTDAGASSSERPAARPIAVTGATGAVGGRVATRLAAHGVPIRLVVRDAARAPQLPGADTREATYADGDAMRTALEGTGTLFLVSAAEAPDRIEQHKTAVDAAVAAGVTDIVYLSFLNAAPDSTFVLGRHHWATEEHIRAAGLPFTFLRDSLYIDFVPHVTTPDGVARGPAGEGLASVVSRSDIADVAVATLLDVAHRGQTYDVTGPEALSVRSMLDILEPFAGRPLTYVDETIDEAYASRAQYGAPDWEVEGWVTSYVAIAAGEMATVSDTVQRVAGHPATSYQQFLRTHPDAYAHLLPR